jgi:hypothetical protein
MTPARKLRENYQTGYVGGSEKCTGMTLGRKEWSRVIEQQKHAFHIQTMSWCYNSKLD